jgi:stage II sporulation protein AA (anti-sigma F factor antagonist)
MPDIGNERASSMERFSVEATGTSDQVVVVVAGEVDLAAADLLRDELDRRIVAGGTMAIDCSAITFIDSMGLRALIEAQRKANEVGARFRLAAVPGPVARVLDLAGVTALFAIHEDSAAALAD